VADVVAEGELAKGKVGGGVLPNLPYLVGVEA
jgi:hypothetical protein